MPLIQVMKIITGIASTTHVDKHFERYERSALEGMADQIKQRYIPNLVDHDPKLQIGVLLYGETFQLSDGEYALGVVSGIFENDQEQLQFKNGATNNVWRQYQKHLNVPELINMQSKNTAEAIDTRKRSDLSLDELLEIHLNSTQVTPEGDVYKIKKLVETTGDLRIEVYPKDHENQPHFHVISRQRGINARFDINTIELISEKAGKITPRDIKKIQAFFQSGSMLAKLRQEHSRLN